MFADYQALVLQTYHDKKTLNELPFHLSHPTAARLKAECIRICEKRYHRKDENLLRSVFEPQEDLAAYRNAIKKTDADKFKSLVIYLKHSSERKTSEKNIELLAWLIDFEHRPYRSGESYAELLLILPPPSDLADQPHHDPIEQIPSIPETLQPSKRSKKIMLLAASITIAGMTTYFIIKSRPLPINGGCMYWDNDHYQPVPCKQPHGEVLFYPLDTQKVAHFKRITQPDTLTPHSLGSVWYAKVNGRIEFYTSKGEHPIYGYRRLLPLSSYILNKYVYHVPEQH